MSIRRVATGSTRSRRWRCAAMRRSASSSVDAAIPEPAALDRRVAGDQPDLVAQPGEPTLDQLDGLHDDRRCTRSVRGSIPARIRGRTAGWTMASRSRGRPASSNTILASARRSIEPPGGSNVGPEAVDDGLADRRVLGSTSRTRRSASMTIAPCSASIPATVDLPQPIGPVIPIRGHPHGARSSTWSQVPRPWQGLLDVRKLAGDAADLHEVGGDGRVAEGQLEMVLAQSQARQLGLDRAFWRR